MQLLEPWASKKTLRVSRFTLLVGACFVLVHLLSSGLGSEVPVPSLNSRVTDLTATLSKTQKDTLERELANFEQQKGSQIAILIVHSTLGEPIEDYAMRVVEKWKLGRQNIDDGVLLLIALNDRKLRIEVGYGLEGVVNDATAQRIIDKMIVPEFKEKRYYDGIHAGVNLLIKIIANEPLPENFSTSPVPDIKGSQYNQQESDLILLIVFSIVGFLLFLIGLLFLYKKGLTTGILGTAVALLILGGTFYFTSLFFIFWFVLGMIFMFISIFILAGSSGSSGGGSNSTTWFSSSGASYSSSSSSFSGGGGSFGGGGASGSW